MATETLQADYQELDEIAQRFGKWAEATEELRQRISARVGALEDGGWQGEASTRFVAEMQELVFPTMKRLTESLEAARQTTLIANTVFLFSEAQAASLFNGIAGNGFAGASASASGQIAADAGSWLDQASEYLRESETGQFIAGLVTGGLAGAAPGGFLVGLGGEATGLSNDLPPAFRMGHGLGEAAWGVAEVIVGAGGEAGGFLLDATGVGAALGIPLNIASAAVIAEGVADVATGVGVFMSAMDDDLPEGTHNVVDDPNADLTQSNSHPEALGANMERAGMTRPPNHEPHHIVPANDPRGTRAAEILREADINVDDAANGVWLPRTSGGAQTPRGIQPEGLTSHDAVHTNRYFNELTSRLERAREADRVAEEMEIIRGELQLGIFPH
jgi:WXG100 family type VII secretion target